MLDGHTYCACPSHTNDRGEHMLAVVNIDMLTRMLTRIFDEEQFLSRYGVRAYQSCTSHGFGRIARDFLVHLVNVLAAPIYIGDKNAQWGGLVHRCSVREARH